MSVRIVPKRRQDTDFDSLVWTVRKIGNDTEDLNRRLTSIIAALELMLAKMSSRLDEASFIKAANYALSRPEENGRQIADGLLVIARQCRGSAE